MSEASKPKQQQCGLYRDGQGNVLIVPTDVQWELHEATKPTKILQRLGMPAGLWNEWQSRFSRDHWVFDFLYWQIPSDARVHWEDRPPLGFNHFERSGKIVAVPQTDGVIVIDREMVRFMEASSVNAIAKWMKSCGHNSARTSAAVYRWRDRFYHLLEGQPGEQGIVRRWLIQGWELPSGYFAASKADVRDCRTAWDYCSIRDELGISQNGFENWFEAFFPHDELPSWVIWLYGGPAPKGYYIIPQRLAELKRRLGLRGIAKASGMPHVRTLYEWQENPTFWQALQDAIHSARYGSGPGKPPKDSKAWNSVFAERPEATPVVRANFESMRDGMLRFAAASTFKSACESVGIRTNTWQGHKRNARAVKKGLEEDLEKWVNHGATQGRFEKCGVVAPGLFLPSEKMVEFREDAIRRGSPLRIPRIMERYPAACSFQWMMEWAVPTRRNGMAGLISPSPADPKPTETERTVPQEKLTVATEQAEPPIVETRANNQNKSRVQHPANPDVRDLCAAIAQRWSDYEQDKVSLNDIAREFTGEKPGDDKKAMKLMVQARRFRHLWDPIVRANNR